MAYKFGVEAIDSLIGELPGGVNILLIGPPMSGKDEIVKAFMGKAMSRGNSVIFVTTKDPGERVLESFERNEAEIPLDRVGIVDCVTKTLGLGTTDLVNIKRAASPVDLTGIGVKISQFLEDFWMKKGIRETWLCINSLSTILMYSNLQTVFRFLHVFTGRVKTAGAIGIYVVDLGMHDDRTINTLKQLFDGMIEIKEEGDGYYMRVVGITTKPTKWFEYKIDGTNIEITGEL